MAESPYQQDIEAILARRYDNCADYWATPDKRLHVGSSFTTLGSALLLSELGMNPSEPVLKETADLIFSTWREDGRFKLSPQGGPCHYGMGTLFMQVEYPFGNYNLFHYVYVL